jgi:hypothetical protein
MKILQQIRDKTEIRDVPYFSIKKIFISTFLDNYKQIRAKIHITNRHDLIE